MANLRCGHYYDYISKHDLLILGNKDIIYDL